MKCSYSALFILWFCSMYRETYGLACDEIRYPFLFGNDGSDSTGNTEIHYIDFDSSENMAIAGESQDYTVVESMSHLFIALYPSSGFSPTWAKEFPGSIY